MKRVLMEINFIKYAVGAVLTDQKYIGENRMYCQYEIERIPTSENTMTSEKVASFFCVSGKRIVHCQKLMVKGILQYLNCVK
jgi:hypothetical protein